MSILWVSVNERLRRDVHDVLKGGLLLHFMADKRRACVPPNVLGLLSAETAATEQPIGSHSITNWADPYRHTPGGARNMPAVLSLQNPEAQKATH
uniref:Uncharacterized protein n=1 Tax=Globodera rostochiensis TaxID=31243 RepID=A0A914HCL8_GLORO